MRTKKLTKKVTASLLTAAMVLSTVFPGNTMVSSAASKKVVTSLKVAKSNVTLEAGKTAKVKVTVKGKKKANKKFTVKTSDSSVAKAKVSGKNVVITAVNEGKTTIKVTTKGKNKKKKKLTKNITVTVTAGVVTSPTAGVSATPSGTPQASASGSPTASVAPSASAAPSASVAPSASTVPGTVAVDKVIAEISPAGDLTVGGVAVITASVTPSDATDKTLTYTSSNTSVVNVTQQGTVTGVSAGTATITIAASNGVSTTIDVTVKSVSVQSVTLDKESVELTVTGTTTLKATVLPEDASNKKVTWSAKDETIAKVSQDGVVTGVAAGETEVYATTEEGNLTATCKVIVKSKAVAADGLTLEMINPYEDNEGTEYPNTILVGDDMSIRARVVKEGQPVGNSSVTLKLTALYGNCEEYFTVRQETVTTDNDGYANFAVGLTGDYKDTSAIEGYYQSYKLTAQESQSNQTATLSVRFASVELNGISVLNNDTSLYNDILPSDNTPWDHDGIYSTTSTIKENGEPNEVGKVIEYVTTQQVSSKDSDGNYVDDHRVYLSAAPYLILPAIEGAEQIGDWEYIVEDGVSGNYSVYNDATNETTTVVVEEVPAGLQYLTAYFDKINLSKYTTMCIDVYALGTGQLLEHKELTVTNNANNSTDGRVQLTPQRDQDSYVVVSLVSQGQVDASNEGYVLTKLAGEWASQESELSEIVELPATVTWTDATEGFGYQTFEWSYEEATDYLPAAFLNEKYSYFYKVPNFPYAGDAVITVKDANNNVKAQYLYPVVNNGENVNELAEPGVIDYAILASEEEVTNYKGSFTTEGNMAIVDSEYSGLIALKAEVEVAGLSTQELNSQNGGVLYTSVQWSPVAKKSEETINPRYFSIEGQTVTVIAQLYDKNGNVKTDEGVRLTVTDSNENEVTALGDTIGGNGSDDTVQVTAFGHNNTGETDSNGQVKMSFYGMDASYLEGLKVVDEDKEYVVKLLVGEDELTIGDDAEEGEVEAVDIYWVDLGLTFVDSAYEGDSPERTTNFSSSVMDIEKNSESKVGNKWYIGYLPVARCKVFSYTDVLNRTYPDVNEFYKVDNIPLTYGKTGVGNIEHKDNVATIYSEKIGETAIEGNIDVSNWKDTSDVVFHFYNENMEIVSYQNIGTGDVTGTLQNLSLKLTMNWKVNGMKLYLLPANGTMVDVNTDTILYVKVTDNYGNPMADTSVEYSITGVNATNVSVTGMTNEKGIYAIYLDAPEEITGSVKNSIITVKAGDDLNETITLNYNDDEKPAFGIDTAAETTVEVLDSKTLVVYFTNNINANSLKAGQFKFVQDDSDNSYTVTSVAQGDDKNSVKITLGEDIKTPNGSHTLSIETYTDNEGMEHDFVDTYGQKITAVSEYSFSPSEEMVTE